MLVVMRHDATPQEIEAVVNTIREMGYEARPMPGKQRTAVGLVGNDGKVNADRLESLSGVLEIIHVSQPYKQVSREWRAENTVVELENGTRIGAGEVCVMAGPCSVESEAQIIGIAHQLRDAGATILRGGAFKPRTSPYSFQGMAEEGLKLLARAREETGMAIVTEAIDNDSLDLVAKYADIVQIGARNMQNFSLLRRAGRAGKPVLLKRGMAATVKDLLLSAEYLLAEGNPHVILCERGVRGFDTHTRNLLDLTAIPVVKSLSHLPIIADPSHGTGLRAKVTPMARAAVAAGADGLMIEVHPDPERALSDGAQSLYPDQFTELMEQIAVIAEAIGSSLVPPLVPLEAGAAGPG
jgi:3-deoxy-7-phosphoheptulonate synthase